MADLEIAEWILSLVLPADRAAAAVGDFAEDSAAHGRVWFWSRVFRATIALLWSDLTETPYQLAALALRASILNVFISFGYLFAFMLLMAPAFVALAWLTHESGPHVREHWSLYALGLLIGAAAVAASALQTGRWIARRAAGREMAACIALCLMQTVIDLAIGQTVPGWLRGGCLLYYAGLFRGATQIRLQSLRRIGS